MGKHSYYIRKNDSADVPEVITLQKMQADYRAVYPEQKIWLRSFRDVEKLNLYAFYQLRGFELITISGDDPRKRRDEYRKMVIERMRAYRRKQRAENLERYRKYGRDYAKRRREKNKTLFKKITSSPEVLAEEFVEMMYDRVAGDYRYYSMLTGEFYNSREEAIVATVEKLKECES
jgi:hypothetical protein